MRVTHSPWRRPSAGSRMRWSTPSRSYRSRISVVPSRELLSVAMTKSAPALRWNATCASMTSASSRASTVTTSFMRSSRGGAASSPRRRSFRSTRTRRTPLDREQALLERVEAPLQPDDVGFAERRDVDRICRLVDDGRARKRQRLAVAQRAERVAQARVDRRAIPSSRPRSSASSSTTSESYSSSNAPFGDELRAPGRSTGSGSGRDPSAGSCTSARTARGCAPESGRTRSDTSRAEGRAASRSAVARRSRRSRSGRRGGRSSGSAGRGCADR